MNWFQRYGIPGAYFCGISVLWSAALYHRQFTEFVTSELAVRIAAGALAGLFLPAGYLISVLGQIIYHLVPGIGVDTRARRRANVQFTSWVPQLLEYRQETITISQIMTTKKSSPDHVKFLLDWMSKRMDMVVMNSSLILATVFAPAVPLCVGAILSCSHIHVDLRWCLLGILVSFVVLVVSVLSWVILTSQLVRVETDMFRSMLEARV